MDICVGISIEKLRQCCHWRCGITSQIALWTVRHTPPSKEYLLITESSQQRFAREICRNEKQADKVLEYD